jgi:transcriptional regulator with XRE-family HTH domain
MKAISEDRPPTPVAPVRAARERAGMTQLQLAARAAISLSTLGVAERFGALSQRTAERLAPVLGCRVEDLLEPVRRVKS